MPRAKVRDYMTEPVYTVGLDATFKQIVELMTIYDISAVPVIRDDATVAGIVTEGDLLQKEVRTGAERTGPAAALGDVLHTKRAVAARKAAGRYARELMTLPVLIASPDEELRRAARRMVAARVKRLPVVDDAGHLVGLLSRHDVLHAFDRPDAQIRTNVEEFLRDGLIIGPDADIKVELDDGVVTLSGRVRFESERRRAEALVLSVDGVVGIENHVWFDEPDPRLQVG